MLADTNRHYLVAYNVVDVCLCPSTCVLPGTLSSLNRNRMGGETVILGIIAMLFSREAVLDFWMKPLHVNRRR